MIAADAQDFDLRDRFPDGFEVRVASEIIEHLVNPGGFLCSIKKHLAPDGVIILSTPHAYGLVYFAEVLFLGEEKIKGELKAQINATLVLGKISEIYFNDYLFLD